MLGPEGYHGPTHWQRVYLNASLICEAEGTDPLVARCFAFLHDACREDEGRDSGHGARAAHFAVEEGEAFALYQALCEARSGYLVTKLTREIPGRAGKQSYAPTLGPGLRG